MPPSGSEFSGVPLPEPGPKLLFDENLAPRLVLALADLYFTCSTPPLTDGLAKQSGDVVALGSGNVAKLDVPKLLAGTFEKTLWIRQRRAVIEAEVYV